jgi:hypothetical protein
VIDHFRAQPVNLKKVWHEGNEMLIPKKNRVAVYSHLFKGMSAFPHDFAYSLMRGVLKVY